MNQYTFGKLKQIIKEQGDLKYKPVIGKNVIKDDAKNNIKAVNDIKKEVKKFTPKDTKKNETDVISDLNFNKTTLDYSFSDKPSKEYIDRVKAQAEGYSSELEKNNKIDKSGEFDDNSKIYNAIKDRRKKVSDKALNLKHAGLKSHNIDKDNFKYNNAFEEGVKKLYFKHTRFLSEENVFDRIPDSYKKNENVFIMEDCDGNEYKIKWVQSDKFDYGNPVILAKMNENKAKENIEKIKGLFNYDSSNNKTDAELRENENKYFVNIINEIRQIEKK